MNLEREIEKTAVAIIGAGPIGIECAIALKRQGVTSIIFEAQQVGDAFTHWPPNTHFFSTPEHVALAGVPVHNVGQQTADGGGVFGLFADASGDV